ncbi:MAG: hypothetical protein FJW39_18770 [Acidobacteria bacterium]|nr:hypothetical protein [Acidobacteriota bacterium]
MKTLIPALVMLALAGCSSAPKEQAKAPVQEGVDIKKNPLSALSSLASAGQEFEKLQQELEAMPPTDPVHFSKLIEALPPVPGGWESQDPKGSTNTMGDFKVSQASRTYSHEGHRVTVEISDWAFNKALYAPFFIQAKFSQESTDGYSKGITVGGDPGREEYKTASKNGSRSMLLRKRYLTKVDIDGLPAEAMQEWAGKLNLSALP